MTIRTTTHSRISSLIAVSTLVVLLAAPLEAQVTTQDLAKAIGIEKLQHPYLYFTNEDKPAILKRIQTDPECKRIMAGLLAEGHRFLSVPVKDPPPARLKHPRYAAGGDEAKDYASEISDGALKLAFLYQMTGDVRYARKAIEFAIALSDLVEWVDAAHKFDIIYPRVWPWNVPDDQVVFSYDIFAAGKSIAVSTVYDWVYPVLTKEERDKLRNGLLEKAITRVRGNYEFFWWSTAYRCNWSAICYSGLGITALSLLKEHPQILDVAAEAYNRINLTYDQIGNDGGWQEGRGYYGYMMHVSSHYADVLKRLTKGKYNLFKHKKVASHPMDFILYTMTANFEDSGGGVAGSLTTVNKLAEETGNSAAAWYREKYYEEGTTLFDILWPRTTVKAVEPAQKSMVFKSINWAVMRSDFSDPAAVTIACKAGYNDDPHHGHLDCGQFILTWQNVPFIRDLGRMEYDEIYFNEERWLYPYASSEGHNVISVNGEGQMAAKLKDKPWKEGVGGEILKFETTAKRDYVLMDPTHAYPGKELKNWRRNIVLDKPVTTLILDEVEAAPGSAIGARFFPAAAAMQDRPARDGRAPLPSGVDYKVYPEYALLKSQQHAMALIPLVLGNSFEIAEDKVAALPVTEDARLNWIPYLETVTKAKAQLSVIATILLPVLDQKDAERVVKTARIAHINPNQIEITVSRDGQGFKWLFEKEKDGFVLKN
ncbi:MAG: heparinase II/III family protein [Ignavibacteria bacterium]|nr:heparinase II/III family protein [Ignavibacteria bacterium]